MTKYEEFLDVTGDSEEEDEWPLQMAATVCGLQQPDADIAEEMELNTDVRVWVLNANVHIDESGRLIRPKASPYIWLGKYYGGKSHFLPYPQYVSCAQPESKPQVLVTLVNALEAVYEQNLPSALLVLGAQVVSLHYEMIKSCSGGVAATIVFGDVQSGKTRATRAGQSLLGISDSHYVKHTSDIELARITSKTTLGIVLDDPTDQRMLQEKLMLHYDGGKIESGGNTIRPRTTFVTSINLPCLESLSKSFR